MSRREEEGELCQGISSPIWVQGAHLVQEAQLDPEIQKLTVACEHNSPHPVGYTVKQGILYYKNKLVISRASKFIPALLQEFHMSASGGHSGYYRMYRRLANNL